MKRNCLNVLLFSSTFVPYNNLRNEKTPFPRLLPCSRHLRLRADWLSANLQQFASEPAGATATVSAAVCRAAAIHEIVPDHGLSDRQSGECVQDAHRRRSYDRRLRREVDACHPEIRQHGSGRALGQNLFRQQCQRMPSVDQRQSTRGRIYVQGHHRHQHLVLRSVDTVHL